MSDIWFKSSLAFLVISVENIYDIQYQFLSRKNLRQLCSFICLIWQLHHSWCSICRMLEPKFEFFDNLEELSTNTLPIKNNLTNRLSLQTTIFFHFCCRVSQVKFFINFSEKDHNSRNASPLIVGTKHWILHWGFKPSSIII